MIIPHTRTTGSVEVSYPCPPRSDMPDARIPLGHVHTSPRVIRLLPNPSHDHGQAQTATREEPYEMVR